MPTSRAEPADATPILRAESISKEFRGRGRTRGTHAVTDVSLELRRERVLALVGESGCGKSTVARLLARLYPLSSGTIWLDGEPVQGRGERARHRYARRIQIVLQDPFSSLNSAYTVRHHLIRPLKLHRSQRESGDQRSLDEQAIALLEEVDLTPGRDFLNRYPHELSGGQRQRVSIARALAVRPDVLLADEPVSMLDVSIRLEVLRLLGRLASERRLALLYITHDIASARYFADQIAVMYAGQLVEFGPAETVTQHPMHPYTQLLISAVPDPGRSTEDRDQIGQGEVQPQTADVTGCRFAVRCPFVMDVCRRTSPPQFAAGDGHWARCYLLEQGPGHVTDTATA